MPRLWDDTIEAHRASVRQAVLDAAARLVAERGLTAVTMSLIAESTGIGRATLYKYFPDIESILLAWHERHVAAHVAHLVATRDAHSGAGERLEAVLHAFASIAHAQHDPGLAAQLHRAHHVVAAQLQLRELLTELVAEAAAAGEIRDDMAAAEVASFCLHALSGASSLSSKAAVQRLVALTMTALGPRR